MTDDNSIRIEPATLEDVPLVLRFIKGLAEYEGLADDVSATEEDLQESLFGPQPSAEAVIAYHGEDAVGLAVFCRHYSTFLGRPILYLEDLFVLPQWRGQGVGRARHQILGQTRSSRRDQEHHVDLAGHLRERPQGLRKTAVY